MGEGRSQTATAFFMGVAARIESGASQGDFVLPHAPVEEVQPWNGKGRMVLDFHDTHGMMPRRFGGGLVLLEGGGDVAFPDVVPDVRAPGPFYPFPNAVHKAQDKRVACHSWGIVPYAVGSGEVHRDGVEVPCRYAYGFHPPLDEKGLVIATAAMETLRVFGGLDEFPVPSVNP